MLRTLPLLLTLLAPSATAQSADLDVDKHAEREEVEVGEEATFYIAVTNYGPDRALAVTLEDVLPEGLVFTAADPSRGRYEPTSGAWTLGSLDAGETEVLELRTMLVSDVAVQNCAGVRASGTTDEATANNTSCVVVRPRFKTIRPKREKLDPLASATLLR